MEQRNQNCRGCGAFIVSVYCRYCGRKIDPKLDIVANDEKDDPKKNIELTKIRE